MLQYIQLFLILDYFELILKKHDRYSYVRSKQEYADILIWYFYYTLLSFSC